jgi:uncharacterized protein
MALLNWGGFEFSIDSLAHDTLSRSWQAELPPQEVLNSNSEIQSTGLPTETITIKGIIFTAHPRVQTDQMPKLLRIFGNAMEPRIMTLGTGETLGSWYLKSIQEEQSGLLKDGPPRKQEMT